ncbi:MAG: transglycosylase domain-containing protein, partial [Chthoniobacteraceae bacterium]
MKRWIFRATFGLIILAAVLEIAILATPLPRALTNGLPPSVEFVDRHGHPLRLMLADERRFSRPVTIAGLSPALIDATLSAEDKRFRSHPGIDPWATLRALGQRVRGDGVTSGASTISQQVIKLASPGPRTLGRKLREIWLALKLEQTWSKDRILTAYLNRLDYGNLRVGIGAASPFYFHKPPSDLSPAEAAFLAGLPKAPGRLNPHENLAAARARQHWVLERMRANGVLAAEDCERAKSEPLHLEPAGRQFEAPHFVDLLLRRKGLVTPDDGVVRTTLDLELNRLVEDCLARNLALIADRHAGSGAVVVIDNASGDVLALAGSGDYFEAGAGQVNGAWIVRSPGSAVKPFTYLLALEHGAEPCTVVPDVATEFATETGIYRPNNYNHRFYGPVSLRFALGNSLNVGAIRTLQLGGGPEALHRLLERCGITTLGSPTSEYGVGLTLGNGEVRLLELANACAALARLGVYRPFHFLKSDALG